MSQAAVQPTVPQVVSSPIDDRYAIRVRHLWHRFGTLDVLRDVTFDVAHGEIFGFIGPNGAGKTTTIRVIATLLEPMAGRVEVNGFDVLIDPDKVRKSIGYMPDHAGVYERVTVREYLEFFADAYRIVHPEVVQAVLELTDLQQVQDKLVATMSKGMKQRLQLARVLLNDPKVLVLDEPASDLDPRARIEMRNLLLELRALGKTIFLSSHILTELADVCTSVAILERGALVVAGPINEIGEQLERRRRERTPAPIPSLNSGPPTERGGDETTSDVAQDPNAPLVRKLRLRVLTDPAHAASLLQGSPTIDSVVSAPNGYTLVSYRGNDQTVAEMVRFLVLNGVGLVGIEPERSELEQIFLEVTRGDLQ